MSKNTIYKIYGISFTLTIAWLIVFMYSNHRFDGSCWQTMQQSKSALTGEYCEQDNVTHFFRQTMNTYSNLMYFFLGMLALLVGLYDKRNTSKENQNFIQEFPAISILFGASLMYLCFGSAFFHASLSWIGQRVDMNGTYSICIVLIGIGIYRYYIKNSLTKAKKIMFIHLLIATILFFIKVHLLISSSVLLPVLILLITLFTIINYTKNKNGFRLQFAFLGLVLMIAAFILRTLDVKKIACHPTSIYQGHALWHFFTGMSAFMLYWFYRSEKA